MTPLRAFETPREGDIGLRRVRAGRFRIEDALTPDALAKRLDEGAPPRMTMQDALAPMPMVAVSETLAWRIARGQKAPWDEIAAAVPADSRADEPIGILAPDGALVAIASNREGTVRVLRGFAPAAN